MKRPVQQNVMKRPVDIRFFCQKLTLRLFCSKRIVHQEAAVDVCVCVCLFVYMRQDKRAFKKLSIALASVLTKHLSVLIDFLHADRHTNRQE
jgi:hypothetical protein